MVIRDDRKSGRAMSRAWETDPARRPNWPRAWDRLTCKTYSVLAKATGRHHWDCPNVQRLPKVRQQEAQNSRTADFSNTADGNSAHRFGGLPGQHTLVTVPYFSGFLAYDILKSKANSHKSCVQHLQEVWKINSHNGPCLKFRSFCDQLDIVNITSSPPYNQRVVGTIEQILTSMGDTDITKALTIFLHTLVSDTLLSPAELFFNRQINTSLSMIMTPVLWTD